MVAALLRQTDLPGVQRAIVEKAPESLWEFTRMAFPLVEPSAPFRDGKHIHLMCEYLQAVSNGEINRLIINVPPGCMKSLAVCVFWPTWEWLRNPGCKWIFASYDASLTRRDAGRAMALMQSKWFVDRWGNLLRDPAPAVGDYYTTSNGFRFATSVGGKATGRHADRQVVDDPVKPKDALGGATRSQAALEANLQWWDQTMTTRVTDAEKSSRVIIMQRLHENDLAGHMLRRGDYEHLCLPMRFDPTIAVNDFRSNEGELLWPERFPEGGVKELEKGLGTPTAIAAQLQQKPTPVGGAIFKLDKIKYWHYDANVPDPRDGAITCEQLPKRGGIQVQSWDLTFKGGDGTDNVSGQTWWRHSGKLFLLDNDTQRRDFVSTCAAIKSMSKRWPKALAKYVEDKANGPAVVSSLQKDVLGLVLVNPEGGKITRANAVTPLFETGCVYLPHPQIAPWVNDFIAELVAFPYGAHDDQVDAMTQALIKLNSKGNRLTEAMARV